MSSISSYPSVLRSWGRAIATSSLTCWHNTMPIISPHPFDSSVAAKSWRADDAVSPPNTRVHDTWRMRYCCSVNYLPFNLCFFDRRLPPPWWFYKRWTTTAPSWTRWIMTGWMPMTQWIICTRHNFISRLYKTFRYLWHLPDYWNFIMPLIRNWRGADRLPSSYVSRGLSLWPFGRD